MCDGVHSQGEAHLSTGCHASPRLVHSEPTWPPNPQGLKHHPFNPPPSWYRWAGREPRWCAGWCELRTLSRHLPSRYLPPAKKWRHNKSPMDVDVLEVYTLHWHGFLFQTLKILIMYRSNKYISRIRICCLFFASICWAFPRFTLSKPPFFVGSTFDRSTLSRETSIKQDRAETTRATMRCPMRWCSKCGRKAFSMAMALESIPQLKLLSSRTSKLSKHGLNDWINLQFDRSGTQKKQKKISCPSFQMNWSVDSMLQVRWWAGCFYPSQSTTREFPQLDSKAAQISLSSGRSWPIFSPWSQMCLCNDVTFGMPYAFLLCSWGSW